MTNFGIELSNLEALSVYESSGPFSPRMNRLLLESLVNPGHSRCDICKSYSILYSRNGSHRCRKHYPLLPRDKDVTVNLDCGCELIIHKRHTELLFRTCGEHDKNLALRYYFIMDTGDPDL